MSWVKLDDHYPDNPKVRRAGALAELIHMRALCYAMRHLTDGFIPVEVVPSLLVGLEDIGVTEWKGELGGGGRDALEYDWPTRMVEAGLWHPKKGGYRIHDFFDYNPSRKEVLAQRKAYREGGKLGAQRRWNKGEEAVASPNGPPHSPPHSHPNSPSIAPSPSPSLGKRRSETTGAKPRPDDLSISRLGPDRPEPPTVETVKAIVAGVAQRIGLDP